MKSLIYNVYRNGAAGLSNLIMSVELGVVMSVLTDRVLVLKGNNTPVANIVQYDSLVTNTYMSRVTDLLDLGVPFTNLEEVNTSSYVPHEIGSKSAWESVFCDPENMSVDTDDFGAFAKGRTDFISIGDELQHVPVLSYSGGPEANTLSWYSFFFYLGRTAQIQATDALRRIRPKAPYTEFSERVVGTLGDFNAVHVRRGDFKKTAGVTTLDRHPKEVIESLDYHFNRNDLLVILTDEARDPFFDEIKSAYKNHLFIDDHVLNDFGRDFCDLPQHDSIAMAFIAQLIASHSQDFVGTMTSTFTGMIQRLRGLKGRAEPFKYLWDELPPPGVEVKPGSHRPGNEVPLNKGIMVQEFEGPYSWNRFNQRLNAAWMREWPESFMNEADLLDRCAKRELKTSEISGLQSLQPRKKPETEDIGISFLGKTVLAGSDNANTHSLIASLFEQMRTDEKASPIGRVRIETEGDRSRLLVDGKVEGRLSPGPKQVKRLYREVVRFYINAHPELVWLHAGCTAGDNGAVLIPGQWGRGKSTLTVELCKNGMSFLSDDIVPLDPHGHQSIPFPNTPQLRDRTDKALLREEVTYLSKSAIPIGRDRIADGARTVSVLVFPHYREGTGAKLRELPPAQAVGQLLENCLSFPLNSDQTIQALCSMVTQKSSYTLDFCDPAEAVAEILALPAMQNPPVNRRDMNAASGLQES
ncbi:MAG: hypothetical protein AAF724_12630 [Pseudomonadota bacterium]